MAFEPDKRNLRLLVTSVALSDLTATVTIYPHSLFYGHRCVSNTRSWRIPNSGSTHTSERRCTSKKVIKKSTISHKQPNKYSSFVQSSVSGTLDDFIAEVRAKNFSRAVLKMDIEGSESSVLMGASKFLREVDVPCIQME